MARTLEQLIVLITANSAQAQAEIRKAVGAVQGAQQAIGKELSGIDAHVRRLNGALGSLGVGFGTAFAFNRAREWVRGIVDITDRADQLVGRLRLVTHTSEELAEVQDKLFALAQRSRAPFESTVALYARMARATQQLGLSQDRLIRLTETINQTVLISGGSVQEATASIIQLGQALSSDRLQGDELRSILENNARLAFALAEGLGVSIGQLREMGKAGELTAERVVKAIESQAETLAREFAMLPRTAGQAFIQLENEFFRLIDRIGRPLQEAVVNLFDTLRSPAVMNVIEDVITAFVEVSAAIVRTFDAAIVIVTGINEALDSLAAFVLDAAENWQVLGAVIGGAAGGPIGAALGLIAGTLADIAGISADVTSNFATWGAILGGLFGGPIGAAIGTAAGLMIDLANATSTEAQVLDVAVEAHQDLLRVMHDAAGVTREAAEASILRAEAAFTQAEAALGAARAEVELLHTLAAIGPTWAAIMGTAAASLEEQIALVDTMRASIDRARAMLDEGMFGTGLGAGRRDGRSKAADAIAKMDEKVRQFTESLRDEVNLLYNEREMLAASAHERELSLEYLQAEQQLMRDAPKGYVLLMGEIRNLIKARADLRREIMAANYAADLEREVAALSQSAVQQQVLNDLRAAGYDITAQYVTASGDLVGVLDETGQKIAQLSKQKFLGEEQIEDLKRFQREVQSTAQEIGSDLTEAIFLGVKGGFDDVLANLGAWMERIALQIVEQQIVVPITAQLVGAVPGLFGIAGPQGGGAGTTATSAWGSELSGLFADISSTFDDVLSGLSDFLGFTSEATASAAEYAAMGMDPGLMGLSPGGTSVFGLGDAVSGLGTGLAIGSLLGAITGNNGMGSSLGGSIGGLAGAALGSIIPGVGTLLGSIIGSVGGGLLGGLFGGGESVGPISVAEIRNPLGDLQLGQVNADNGGASAREFANGIIDLVTRSVEAVGGALGGGRVTTDVGNLQEGGGIYVNPTGNFGAVEDVAQFFGDDAEAAAIAAARYIAQQAGVEGLARGVVDALDKAFATATSADDLEERLGVINLAFSKQAEELGPVAAAIEAVNKAYDEAAKIAEELGIAEARLTQRRERDIEQLADAFVRGLQDQILQATDPQAFALLELRRWRKEQIREAEAAGRGLAEIEELYGIRRQQILEQYARAGADTLQRFLEELQGGDLAGLTPRQQLAYDQRQYERALAAAMTDGTTDEEQQALADAASALLETARAMYASGSQYFDLKDQIEAAIREVLGNLPGFASGTSSTPSGPYWVGEDGPELMMGAGAQIIPHPASMALAERMAAAGMPALPTFNFGGAGLGGADMSGVIAAVQQAGASNTSAIRALTDEVRSLKAENAELRQQMQRVGAGVSRTLAQPPGSTAGPRKRSAA